MPNIITVNGIAFDVDALEAKAQEGYGSDVYYLQLSEIPESDQAQRRYVLALAIATARLGY